MKTISTATLGALLLGATLTVQALPTLTLSTQDLTGHPGETIGWGFVLTNDDAVASLAVTGVYADGSLFGAGGASALGTFADAIADWSLALGGLTLAPGQTYTGSFPATGLASFAIKPDAEIGGLPVTGAIFLDYELDDGNTSVGGTLTARYNGQDALASVSVVAPAAAPAPATVALLALGLVGLVRRRTLAQRRT